METDYAQIERRLTAQLDLHLVTASKLFDVDLDKVTPEQRKEAKAFNFRLLYGGAT